MGILKYMAMGRARRRARRDEVPIARGSQKLEPSLREREKRSKKVMCMRM
jgi:hypothetical protein